MSVVDITGGSRLITIEGIWPGPYWQLWVGLQVLSDVSEDVLDRPDIVLSVVKRGVLALVENGAQLLSPVAGCLKGP